MSRSSGRARRREDSRKAQERARKVLRAQFARSQVDLAEVDALARKLADNLANCSCPLCANPRKWAGEHSFQELRAALDEHDER